jgi:hypothetical protein
MKFWADGQQPFPYRVMEELPVIRSESSNVSALFQASKRIFAPEAIRYS